MGSKKIIQRELEVAFSKKTQPTWFRILKYVVLGFIVFIFWGTKLLWMILPLLFILSLLLHFWFRYKTKAWTRSYGPWKYHKPRASPDDEERNT